LVDTAGLTYSVNLRRAVEIQIDRRHKSTNDRESVKKIQQVTEIDGGKELLLLNINFITVSNT